MVAFLLVGDIILAILFQGGRFGSSEVLQGWYVLAAFSIGLISSALGRLNSSALYALGDTRTPMRIATIRVVLSTLLAVLFCLVLPQHLGYPDYLPGGLIMLGAASSVGAILENFLLRGAVRKRGILVSWDRQLPVILLVALIVSCMVRVVYLRLISFSS